VPLRLPLGVFYVVVFLRRVLWTVDFCAGASLLISHMALGNESTGVIPVPRGIDGRGGLF